MTDQPVVMHVLAFLTLLMLCNVGRDTYVTAVCSKPTLNSNSYTLTADQKEFVTNDTYEINCIPGYTISGDSILTCQSTTWSSTSPECVTSASTYPWWLLLVAVMVVVLMISCILPRLFVCLCRKSDKKRGDDTSGLRGNTGNGYDDDDDESGRSESPPPDLAATRNNRMTNMDFMSELHADKDLSNLKRAKKNAVF